MITSEKVKEILFSLGADLCGIASIDRFSDAPKGYHPLDVLPTCKSVISFACRFPVGTLICNSLTPYIRAKHSSTAKVDAIALDFCIEMEKNKIVCIPIPTNEDEWDEATNRMRSIVSQAYAAQAAGLGTIGRHSLLITPEFGNMICLGAVLCEQELEPDDIKETICNNCDLCVKACPSNALEGQEMDQQACWKFAFPEDDKNKVRRIVCHKCRDICPYSLGSENSLISIK